MAQRVSNDGLADRLGVLFPMDENLPCSEGTTLLRAFAEARPADFAFLKPGDLINLHNSAFAGILEWETFSEHYGSCELCHA
ncbi:hypothetical protein [Granulicella sp. dw_53]|uniref:hypothetical protein n=1 Tax=Granulicella sp. dw_53 TaxID=2719792 RepID=UPI001BD69434|nr:hypothetical protein [Granulicella sp. dw_53]